MLPHLLHRAQTNRPAPIVRHQRCRFQIQVTHQLDDIVNPPRQRVLILLRLIRQPAANVIDRDAPIPTAQAKKQIPPIKRPRVIAMHEEQRLARSFVQIVQLLPMDPDKMRRKRIQIPPRHNDVTKILPYSALAASSFFRQKSRAFR